MNVTLFSLSICAAFFLAGCDDKPANSLVGSWKSDKSKTLVSMYELLVTKFKELFKGRACYYELTSEWNFREYFCRVND